jgi:Holliday junction resolvase RusA-like endonuclease
METIKIKPLSVNEVWRGKRFKTDKYKYYEAELMFLLRKSKISVPDGRLSLEIEVGFSSKSADIDNVLKPFIDVLQKKYSFNDNRIYRINIGKTIVSKGKEFIKFEINPFI